MEVLLYVLYCINYVPSEIHLLQCYDNMVAKELEPTMYGKVLIILK